MAKKIKKYQGDKTGSQVQSAPADKTAVKINVPKYNPSAQAKKDATEKLQIAKQLYKDNPGKVYYDAVKKAEQNTFKYKKTGGTVKSKKKK
jgi:hypothetical protein